MDDFFKAPEAQWKGGNEPTSFPHRCPYRPDGIEKAACIAMSGTNIAYNQGGCCGTARGETRFPPCNSTGRRCLVCLQIGRRGERANSVADMATGRCAEHKIVQQAKAPLRQPVVRPAPVPMQHTARPEVNAGKSPATAPAPHPAPAQTVERKEATPREKKTRRRGPQAREMNFAALESASAKLLQGRRRLMRRDLIREAAKTLGMSVAGLQSFWTRSVPKDVADRLLYGESGKKVTRAEEKFAILMEVRAAMRTQGLDPPTKRQLAQAAAQKLGMTALSAESYVYERLPTAQVQQLELALSMTHDERIKILRKARDNMRGKGAFPPRQIDLAAAVAPIMGRKAVNVRSMIGALPLEIRTGLELAGGHARTLHGLDAATIRRAFIGAIDVLKVRREPVSRGNVRKLLRISADALRLYLQENPDIVRLLD